LGIISIDTTRTARFLTFAAAATVIGPTLLLNLKRMAEADAIAGRAAARTAWRDPSPDMLARVDPSLFLEKFGCGLEGAASLVSSQLFAPTRQMVTCLSRWRRRP
jgi:hypothetical protein